MKQPLIISMAAMALMAWAMGTLGCAITPMSSDNADIALLKATVPIMDTRAQAISAQVEELKTRTDKNMQIIAGKFVTLEKRIADLEKQCAASQATGAKKKPNTGKKPVTP